MPATSIPNWLINLDEDELRFVKSFLIKSGSLKALAKEYDVSYPTVRVRLDRLIEKICLFDNPEPDSYVALIKSLAIDNKVHKDAAKILIDEYHKSQT